MELFHSYTAQGRSQDFFLGGGGQRIGIKYVGIKYACNVCKYFLGGTGPAQQTGTGAGNFEHDTFKKGKAHYNMK